MPVIHCPVPNCDFKTDDLDSVVAAAILTAHTTIHTSAPNPAERVKRPTISSSEFGEDRTHFKSRLSGYLEGTKANSKERVVQLLEYCVDTLRRDLTQTSGNFIEEKSEEDILTSIRSLAVVEENATAARVTLHSMTQGSEETVRSFAARLRGQADLCKFNVKCTRCDNDVNYTDEILHDLVSRGLYDPNIQTDLLRDRNKEMELETVLAFVESKEFEKQCASRLSSQEAVTNKRKYTINKCYKCKICNKTFYDSGNLRKHNRIHTGGKKPYICKLCNKSFSSSYNLKRHNRIHTDDTPDQCEICHKDFSDMKSLQKHKRIHTHEQPNKCGICDKSFNNAGALKVHKRTHTGEQPYKCEHCDKRFSQSRYLRSHETLHTGDHPYKCDVCDKTFGFRGPLHKHMMIHTGDKHDQYNCDVCDKRFNSLYSLQRHNKIHTGEKPYTCYLCDRSFRHSFNLRTHERIHTGEHPYKCDICNKTFIRSCSLQKHKTKHK